MKVPYLGRVISSVPGYPQWFNVIYCDDPAVYVYKLAEDYADGDLEIIAEGSTRQPYLVQIVKFPLQFFELCYRSASVSLFQHKLLFSG